MQPDSDFLVGDRSCSDNDPDEREFANSIRLSLCADRNCIPESGAAALSRRHQARQEYADIHQFRVVDSRCKIRLRQNIAFHVDARRQWRRRRPSRARLFSPRTLPPPRAAANSNVKSFGACVSRQRVSKQPEFHRGRRRQQSLMVTVSLLLIKPAAAEG